MFLTAHTDRWLRSAPDRGCPFSPCQRDLLVSAVSICSVSLGSAILLMVTVFRGCLTLYFCSRLLWKILTLSQHLPNSHVNAGRLQVLGTDLPVLLRALLNDWASRKVWRKGLVQARRQSCPFGVGKDAGHSMVQQAAEARHHHNISTVHEHGCWGLLPLQAPKQKDGGLPKTEDGERRENKLSYRKLCVQ